MEGMCHKIMRFAAPWTRRSGPAAPWAVALLVCLGWQMAVSLAGRRALLQRRGQLPAQRWSVQRYREAAAGAGIHRERRMMPVLTCIAKCERAAMEDA